MPRGGARPNSGPITDPAVKEFRLYWREKFDQPRWRKWLGMKAIRNERILLALLAHAYGTPPQSVRVDVAVTDNRHEVVLAGGATHASTAAALPAAGLN